MFAVPLAAVRLVAAYTNIAILHTNADGNFCSDRVYTVMYDAQFVFIKLS